jgi:hypothetical protein
MRFAGIVGIVLCGVISGVGAQSSEAGITYKGVPLGVSREEFAAKFPDYRCRDAMCTYDGEACAGKTGPKLAPNREAYLERNQACIERTSLGGAYVESATAHFRDGKLSRMAFYMPSRQVNTLIDAARQRYGKATDTDEAPFKTKGGGTFDNLRITWEINGTLLIATSNGPRLGTGSAVLTSTAEIDRSAAERKADVKKSATDF